MTNSEEAKETRELKQLEEETDVQAASITDESEPPEEPSIVYQFKKPYKFEGTEYPEIDLSGICKFNTRDSEWLDRMMRKSGHPLTNKWHETTYLKLIAQRATGYPIEFFNYMPMRDFLEIAARVQAYFLFM